MLLPYSLRFLHVKWLQVLVGHWFIDQLTANPLDRTLLVAHEKLVLLNFLDFESSSVVFADLIGQKVHPIPFGNRCRRPA